MVEWKYINEIIISLKTGLNPRQNFRLNTPESFYPYITGKDIYNNKINVTSVTDKVDSKAVVLINKRANLEDNLLLFASTGTGTVGRMAIVAKYGNDWAISETLYAIKTSKAISPHFLMYSLYSDIAKKQYEPKISKGSVPHLKIADLLNVKIPIPSLSEQQSIVSILDTFTKSIENLKTQIVHRRKQYEHYRDQLLDLEGKKGVEMKALREICGIYDGTHQTPNYKECGIKFVSVENIKDIYTSTKYISIEDYLNNYKTKPQKDDVLMTRIGEVGSCAVIDRDEPIAYYVSLALLRPNVDIVLSNYVKYILESKTGKTELRKRTLLTAVPLKINLGDIGKVRLPIPSLSEQQRIVSILDTFEASIRNLEAQLAERQKQYEYYRNKLLTFE